jgi:tRNA 2-thiouridine synthesizing protein A
MPPEVLDTRGLRCPVPANRTRDRLKAMAPGAELTVLGDDPLFVLDVRALADREGHAYLGHRDADGGGVALTLRKSG